MRLPYTINKSILNEETNAAATKVIPELSNKKITGLSVLKIEGDRIIINAGEEHGIKHGFVGYVTTKGDYGTKRYIAEFMVEQVFDYTSRCVVKSGRENLHSEGYPAVIK